MPVVSKEILAVFENYQNGRRKFSSRIAELSQRPRNIEALQEAGVLELLRPLLLDNVPSVQQSAALALGRLANYSDHMAEAVVSGEILPQLVFALSTGNKHYKRSAAYVLRSVAKHSPMLASAVVDSGAVEALVGCLESMDPGVKESAAWALGYIAKHNGELAQAVVDHDAVTNLVLCVQEPELSLKRVSASALSYICRHSPELAQTVVDANAIPNLTPLIKSPDAKLKRQVCSCLGHIAQHSTELAELVVDGEIFDQVFKLLEDQDKIVSKNAATLIREIVKHSKGLSKLVVNAGGLPYIVEYLAASEGDNKLPAAMTIGFISAFGESLAKAVIATEGIEPLGDALSKSKSDHVKAACAWSLGKIGGHSSEHARSCANNMIFVHLMGVYLSDQSSEDLHNKAKSALKAIIAKCTDLQAFIPLLNEAAPPNILTPIAQQIAKILPHDVNAKKLFVTSRGLAKLQEIKEKCEEDSPLYEAIGVINNAYPEEVIRYFDPNYSQFLLSKIADE